MQTVRNILEDTRTALKDEQENEYSDKELLMYMSGAIDYISNLMAAQRSVYTRKAVWVTASPAPLPDDFLTADAIDDNITIYNDCLTVEKLPTEFRYFYKFARPTRLDEVVAIPTEFIPAIAQYIISRALLRNEYSVTAEQRIESAFMSSILEVAKKRGGVAKTAERKERYLI